ncbi:hypothetical protein SISNIDRAFT_438817 [Sistotremastrum niveocremeum HHB9708]|uniref:SAC domain-containing protein n=1 Tax=Sistotremastrum niveocremeum HHB9708 TaxID=1314777 RepID=A0A164XPN1_9AGAM|nr:hypothetical protein SISNIDRAFT_438817 [Sistotremastrum niveocremeum HHB9708]
MSGAKGLHQRLDIHTGQNQTYVIQPVSPVPARAISIHRQSGEIEWHQNEAYFPRTASKPLAAYGIIGVISLVASEYLIVITSRQSIGEISGHEVYQATEFEFLPLQATTPINNPVEAYLLALAKSHLKGGLFLFSYTWDLTRRLQAQWVAREADNGKALWEVADDRFFWNKYLHSKFIDHTTANPDQDLSAFILPILYGTCDIRHTSIKSHPLTFILISRRSRYRAGTRYFRRGIDNEGHVANFNETEQIVVIERPGEDAPYLGDKLVDKEETRLSYVQTRGSVPVYWAEVNNLRYKPDLQIMELQDTMTAFKTHLQEQVALYGPQNIVNLVNQKGHELPVKEAFEKVLADADVTKVKYEYFDFHNECRKMRWDRINILIDRIQDDLIQEGYFHENSSETHPLKIQIGTVRTNCMDNLDRTNVVQSTLAKWVLNRQLRDVGILAPNETVDEHEGFMHDYRLAWADHADLISKAYSGTGALKTDFTRTGKRTKVGLLDDGYKSVMRYLKNNYFDGPRQDGFDLITGTWTPRRGPLHTAAILYDDRPLLVRSMPYVLWFAIFMICAGLTLPRSSDLSLTYYFLLWFVLLISAASYIFIHGIEYVSWPRLNRPVDIIHYEGPGFRGTRKGRGLKSSAFSKGHTGVKPETAKGRPRAMSRTVEIEMGNRKRVD